MPPKIAIVHDYLNQMGGAERVVAVFHELFPEAPIFTTIVDRSVLIPELAEADIRASWMQGLPGWKKHFKKYLLLYPQAIESLDLREYEVIISSSSAFAKGARKGERALHVCYCYTPMRFAWDYENYLAKENLSFVFRGILPAAIRRLRKWDLATRSRPDRYIAISSCVRERIGKIYGKDAEVIYPPVEVQKFHCSRPPGNFFLIVSRLAAYKRLDLAVRAFNILGLPLKIVGSGPACDSLKKLAGANIEFLGRIGDAELADVYAGCKALIFPGVEDFGLVPLEANAAGRPAIAFRGGGALDTIEPGVNGLFFQEPSAESLIEAVRILESGRVNFQPERIREHARKFDKSVFKERFRKYLAGLLGPGKTGGPEAAQYPL
jgi:glycosyltransferase involved in cell wall biosynthesis